MFKPAERLNDVQLSGIRHLIAKCEELAKQGRDIIHLEIGRPDFDTPVAIKEAAKKAIDEGKVHYPPLPGIPELRAAVCKKLKEQNGLDYKPSETLIFNGASHIIYCAMLAFLNEGDEVLMANPTYTSYLQIPQMVGAKKVFYSQKESNNFQVDRAELESLVTEKTKMICVINPSNPLGALLNNESLQAIADVANKHNLIVLSDEIYERLCYDGDHVSLASFPGMRERTIILNGFSKTYSMTGWRLGYAAAPEYLIEPMNRMIFYTVSSTASFTQYGAVEALEGDQSAPEAMKAEYRRRRDYMYEAINKIPKLSCLKPEGAFYIFMNIKETGLTSQQFSDYILDKADVALVPGTEFGTEGEGYVRISYANSMENLKEAIRRIEAAVAAL